MASKDVHERVAVITGANKGIGWEIVRQLANTGMTVVLTARNEERGVAATSKLHKLGLSNVVFHQLDVTDYDSITLLVHFIETKFGRLDVLKTRTLEFSSCGEGSLTPIMWWGFDSHLRQVNNAAANGMEVDGEELRALKIDPANWLSGKAANLVKGVMKTTYATADECFKINYYGVKTVTEALLPLLKLSPTGARIVNVSSLRGELWRISNDDIKNIFANVDNLTEDKIHEMLQKFLQDVKQGKLIENGWPSMLPAYGVSKTAVNAYTRLLARKLPQMYVNCVHPGHVVTDLNWHTGTLSTEEGAKGPVQAALLPDGGLTGCYFDRMEVASY